MERTSNGYTIVEVMIVLAVSTLLLFAAIRVFSGSQAETQFSQAMQDINSKIQNYTAQVKAGNFQNTEQYTCDVSSSHPFLTAGSSDAGTNQKCLFLGRAIEGIWGGHALYAYTVLGTRNQYDGGNQTAVAAADIKQANPEVAIAVDGTGAQTWVLTDKYDLPYGVVLVSAKKDGDTTNAHYDLLGIYTNLQSSFSGSGSAALSLRGYPFIAPSDVRTGLKDCIEEVSPSLCINADEIRQWDLCFQDPSDSSRTAQISVNSRPDGIITRLDYGACS